MSTPALIAEPIRTALAEHAAAADGDPVWPEASWQALRQSGALEWCIPPEHGGRGLRGVELLRGYEELSGACLTTCFLLSQRDAAARRLRDGDNEELRRTLLPALARGDAFATVGLSQLTTSRQHVKPSLTATAAGGSFHFQGTIPWVTGAERADYLVIGAVLDDGRQVLAVLPRATPGVTVGPPLDLMALRGSMTAEVRCDGVELDGRWLLAGPSERVLAAGRGGAGGLETSCLALGLAGAAVAYLRHEAAARPELRANAERLEVVLGELRREMHDLARGAGAPDRATTLRGRANALVLQATQAALTASKGTGFLHSHPAQRWARQAMFFLVWSCPRPAAEATLAFLTPAAGPECV
jgi:alkylation response protein AidB-like acyl-CoA dehydrogenase